MRLTPVMLALLLALSPGAVAVQASAPTASASAQTASSPAPTESDAPLGRIGSGTVSASVDGNTSTVMTLGSAPARSAFGSPSLSLGSSLAVDREVFRTRLRAEILNQRLSAANTAEKKKQILNRFRYRIENRIISLKANERRATQAFSNGTLSEQEYLRTLGRTDAAAADTRELIDAMQAQADSVPRFNMNSESDSLKGKLVTLEGPIRDRLSKAIRGERAPTRTYVATNENGIVLSTIANGEYVREIVRKDKRNPSLSDDSDMGSARESIVQQYPWAYEHRKGTVTDSEYGTNNIYRMKIKHTQGEVVAYYDGGTKSIFREIQYKRLVGQTTPSTGPAVTNTSENLTVTVNQTYAGGPLRVKLTNATGAPVQGEVSLDGEPVGRTDSNGVLWTLSPVERFEVSASYDFRTVNATATPVES